MAATTLQNDALLDPEECGEREADCADADVDTLVGGIEGIRSGNLEILMEMERFSGNAKEEDQGAVAVVLDLAKAFECMSFPVVWVWATHFKFPTKILRMLCGYFEHQRRVQFEGCLAEPLRTITACG